MKSRNITINQAFVGRQHELARLQKIGAAESASMLIIYGRRRVGKTEILEQAYRDRNILKFEGIEGKSQALQRQYVVWQLADYVEDPAIKENIPKTWLDVFKLIANYITQGKWTLYFEEVQWLADYESDFVAELKYIWDNEFRHNKKLLLILCGSSPSFIINKVIHSKALYNRSQHVLHLQELSLTEAAQLLKKRSQQEVLEAYLAVGGIPEYLNYLQNKSSIFLSLCYHSFTKDEFFTLEHEKIFTSSLANNKHYQSIIELLAKRRYATRKEIANYLKITSGGTLTNLLDDLELCGFIQKYVPYNTSDKSLLTRYSICDCYLQFYYKFIKPVAKDIANGDFNAEPAGAINKSAYQQWLGYAFERYCQKNHKWFAKRLGFGAVKYRSGSFYNRNTDKQSPGYQIDLVFDRDDRVITICEIRYQQTKLNVSVIEEFEKKLALFENSKNKTIERVLITVEGVNEAVINRGYFDHILMIKDLFII